MSDSIPTLVRELVAAQARSTKASEARLALPAGSSRARVTTANARWMRASEERDRREAALRAALERTEESQARIDSDVARGIPRRTVFGPFGAREVRPDFIAIAYQRIGSMGLRATIDSMSIDYRITIRAELDGRLVIVE